jgi:hypothetical protein
MYIKINDATRLKLKEYQIPKDIVFEDCRLYVYDKSWSVKYNIQEDNVQSDCPKETLEPVFIRQAVLLIQIDKSHEVWEFENTFGLGAHCEGFVPGMIVAFKPNNETGIIVNSDINLIFK